MLSCQLHGPDKCTVEWLKKSVGMTALMGAALGLLVYYNTVLLNALNVITYEVSTTTLSGLSFSIYACSGAALLLLLRYYLKSRQLEPLTFNIALTPLLLSGFVIIFSVGFYTPLLTVAILGWSVFRLTTVWPGKGFRFKIKEIYAWLIILGGFALFSGYGFLLQIRSYNSLVLCHSDWGLFLNVIDNTLKGNWFHSNEIGYNFLGRHFIPGSVLLLAPFVALFRNVNAFFLMNSAVLYSCGPMIYLLARKLKLGRGAALVLGFCMMLHPSLSNMVMAIYYGFHVIYLFIPCLILFFLFFERDKLVAAAGLFLFSLTLKETVAVFWLGTALMMFIQGRHRRFTGAMAVISLLYFLVIVKIVMPSLSPANNYDLMYRYSQLGDSMTAIALSPFTRPEAFFGTLFQVNNFYLFFLLLLPLCCLNLSRPLLLLGALPLLLFVCLQKNRELQTIALWYPSTALALIMANAAVAARRLHPGNRWFQLLRYDLEDKISRRKLRTASLTATLVMSVLACFFWGLAISGKNSALPLLSAPDCSADKEIIEAKLPPGKTVNATPRIGGWFVLRNRVFQTSNDLQEYALFDINDPLGVNAPAEQFRYKILSSGKYRLLLNYKSNGHQYLLFHREDKVPVMKPPFIRIPEQKWKKLGRNMPVQDVNFSVRGGLKSKSEAVFFIRLNRKVNYDAAFNIQLGNAQRSIVERIVFGDGVFPAYNAKPGDVFPVIIKIPNNLHPVTKVTVEDIKFGEIVR